MALGKRARIIVKNCGNVIDMEDHWNNRASAECAVYREYPQAKIKFITDKDTIKILNAEWTSCKNGA